jgi:SNF2 family DNA or RNA helicase
MITGRVYRTYISMFTVQSPVAGSVIAKKILVVAPASLLNNWAAEFRKWLGTERVVCMYLFR